MNRATAIALVLLLVVGYWETANGQATPAPGARPIFLSFAPYAGPAVAFAGDGAVHISYQLLLVNYEKNALRLVTYAVKSADPSCPDFAANYTGDSLASLFILTGASGEDRSSPHSPTLQSSQSATLFVLLDRGEGDCVPSAFSNTLVVQRGSSAGLQTINGPNTYLSPIKAPVLAPPLRGANWWTPNGPANNSVHRRTAIVLDGKTYYPQAYAVDWVRLNDHGRTFSGDPHINGSYLAYKSPVYAAADGVVVSVSDGIAENMPVQDEPARPAVPISVETIAGNCVIEDLGGGFFALYAHLIPGTLKVARGQWVHAGDMLGQLGNSGNSTEPHLHFQVMDSPAALQANGLPFVLNSWTRLTYRVANDSGGRPANLVITGSTPVTDQDFMSLDLGNF